MGSASDPGTLTHTEAYRWAAKARASAADSGGGVRTASEGGGSALWARSAPAARASWALHGGRRPCSTVAGDRLAVLGLAHVSLSGFVASGRRTTFRSANESNWSLRTMTDALRRTQRQSGRCCQLLCVTPRGAPCACLEAQCHDSCEGCRHAISEHLPWHTAYQLYATLQSRQTSM